MVGSVVLGSSDVGLVVNVFLVLGDFSMDLLGFCCVYFGFGCLLILVWINLVDFGRYGFGC